MASGAMWWAASEWSTRVPQGMTVASVPDGLQFSGAAIGPTVFWPGTDFGPWHVEVKSHYFLDPPRMPATGDPFVSLPMLKFAGGLGMSSGVNGQIGEASCSIELTQSLRLGGFEVASSSVSWWVGWVRLGNVLHGQNILTSGQRDYGALFFNLDRTQTLSITLITRFDFSANLGGAIGFAPLVVSTPQWLIHSLD